MSSQLLAAAVAAAVGLAATPYLAGLTLTAADRDDTRWWRFTRASTRRQGVTALAVVTLAVLGGITAHWGAVLPPFVALALTGGPLAVIDFELHRLPKRLTHAMGIAGLLLGLLAAVVTGEWHSALRAVEGAAAVFALFFVINFISPKAFGYGDVRLGGVLGGYLGWFGWGYVIYGILGGLVIATVYSLFVLAVLRTGRKTPIPLGPMLLLGGLVVLAADLVPAVYR